MRKVITIKVDTSVYKQKVREYVKENHFEIRGILSTAAPIYANHAQQYVPPSMGKTEIDDVFYKRKLVYLPFWVRRQRGDKKEKKIDIEQLRKGYLFKIRQYKGRRKYFDHYFKKVTRKVKEMRKIKNRGLLRVSFAMDLVSIGQKYPSKIKKLLSKSKNLRKFKQFNIINFVEDTKLEIINDSYQAYEGDTFAKIAVREGDRYAQMHINRRVRAMIQRNKKL